ncbi:hypothetical protein FRZ67_16980 [Panacibacter ginsenosidivorans]|uniref:Uncharacterized protein n=1 Tax=Panacibacter ginsenosidivorans TaxID=1813871 RepID=A0A5B8VBN8_9BACT|nr:hypothetical protein [Panacibacter ginsenosidivorans]QEC68920.1 hypothetical protein FRZ67_16980 [Panacibacter ginsenosidivorans]
MSQFDFPRINFHGQAFLDTPTANNGYIPNVILFNQSESGVFVPPWITFDPTKITAPTGSNPQPVPGSNGTQDYIYPLGVTGDNFQQWCTTPLGTFSTDSGYEQFYQAVGNYGMNPGYWNYYGDISMALDNVVVTGITVPDTNNNNVPVTYSADNIDLCPEDLSILIGAELSFNSDYFTKGSRTTAFLCDVDSEGQLCTQIFYGQAGLYKSINGSNITFFKGHPVKSTVHFMNLFRVLNYANIVPMGGSASFYTTIEDDSSNNLTQLFSKYGNGAVNGIFIKILIHEVHEVRDPDYSNMPIADVTTVSGNKVQIPKNPAKVSITGSITPWSNGDMKTTSISRILKNAPSATVAINSNGIDNPIPQGANGPLGIPSAVNLAPVPFIVNASLNLISLDLSNMLHEYGANPGTMPPYSGNGDIPPYQDFINYNYGTFNLMFQPDAGGSPSNIGSITYADNYNMQQFINTAGMVDISLPSGDYSTGYFYLSLNNINFLTEDDLYIITDQQGIYAEQNQTPPGLYMSDGLPRIPCTLRVFSRGVPVSNLTPASTTVQGVNLSTMNVTNTNIQVFDGLQYTFPVDQEGCITYLFPTNSNEKFPTAFSLPAFAYLAMNTSLIVCRVLSEEPQLAPYLSGQEPITWEVVFTNVLQLYKTVYPIMDIVLPINEQTWSDPFIQKKILMLTDESNWNQPLFMPITRDMSATQRQLLQMWIKQSQQLKKQTTHYE